MDIAKGYRTYACLIILIVFLVLTGTGVIVVADSLATTIVIGLLGSAGIFLRAAVGSAAPKD